jgi:Domain of unknown function (DUF4149)
MALLRFASVLVLAIWVGGLATLGSLAAPEIFNVLERHDPESGRVLAGEVFGAVFQRFQRTTWVLGALLIALYGLRALLGPRPRQLGLRVWAAIGLLAMSLAGGLFIAPRIDAIRRATSGPIASLPDGDATRAEFGRLHGLSTGLMLLTLLAGAGLMWTEMRDPQ